MFPSTNPFNQSLQPIPSTNPNKTPQDLIIDLHNTTANTGVALLMAPDDEWLGGRWADLEGPGGDVLWFKEVIFPICIMKPHEIS